MSRRSGAGHAELVKLNVGGHRFVTTRQTLTHGENFFTALLSGRTPAIKDDRDHYFIDRDGQYFGVLLEFLRTGELIIPPSLRRDAVLREAAFYLIDTDPIQQRTPRTDGVYTRYHYSAKGSVLTTSTEFLVFIPSQELLSGLHGLRHFQYTIDNAGLITYSVDKKLESLCFESIRPSFRPFVSPKGRVFITETPTHICSLRVPGGGTIDRHLLRLYFHDDSAIFVVMQPEFETDYQELRHTYTQSQAGPYPLYSFEVTYDQQAYGFICIVTARELWLRYKGMPVWNVFHEISFANQELPPRSASLLHHHSSSTSLHP